MKCAGASPKTFAAPGGERLDQVKRRVLGFFDSMCSDYCKTSAHIQPSTPHHESNHTILSRFCESYPLTQMPKGGIGGHVIVVSHGGPIDCLLRHFKERYGCHLSSGTVTPNTGVSSFIARIRCRPHPTCISISALVVHDTTHLTPEMSKSALLAHEIIPVTPDIIHITPDATQDPDQVTLETPANSSSNQ